MNLAGVGLLILNIINLIIKNISIVVRLGTEGIKLNCIK